MKPVKQMKIELGLKAIREENDELADRRSKRIAKQALDRETALSGGVVLPAGTSGPRGPFYSNREMRRAAGRRPSVRLQFTPTKPAIPEQDVETVRKYSLRDMAKAVRGLRRKV